MTTFKNLCEKAKDLYTLLKPKQPQAVPSDAMVDAYETIDRLMQTLKPYLAASVHEKRRAKAHPTASQIIVFTTADRDRKKYFNLTYFQKRFRDLPADERRLVASTAPKTLAGFRDALILYLYRKGEQTGQDLLKEFHTQTEQDYFSLPAVREYERMKSLYRELLIVRNRGDVASRVCAELQEEADLLKFAKVNKLKIPAQRRGKNVPQTSAHERLAEVIFKKGALVRLDIA